MSSSWAGILQNAFLLAVGFALMCGFFLAPRRSHKTMLKHFLFL